MPISSNQHDYIGLSENSTMENSGKSGVLSVDLEKSGKVLNLKATELRLGLPGSESPEREDTNGHGLLLKSLVSGAKRGFDDTINGAASSANWGFSPRTINGPSGSETETLNKSGNMLKEGVPHSPKPAQEKKTLNSAPASKWAQVVGWPPIRSFRKNSMAVNPSKTDEGGDGKSGSGCLYVKVSMDGAPYLRKVDLGAFNGYKDLSSALEKMFSSFTIGQYCSQGIASQEGSSESRFKDLLRNSEFVLTFEDKDGDWMLVGDVPWEMFMDSCKRLRIMKSSDAIGLAPRGVVKCKTEN